MRESVIEKKVSDYAKSKGFLTFKFVSPNKRGVCDQIFIYNGCVAFLEFKAKNGKTTKQQDLHHIQLRKQNVPVYVVNSIELGNEVVNEIYESDGYNRI